LNPRKVAHDHGAVLWFLIWLLFAVADLTRAIPTPALDGRIDQDRARVIAAGGDAFYVRKVDHVQGAMLVSGVLGSVANLAVAVLPPTLHRPAVQQGASEFDTRRDAAHSRKARDVHRNVLGGLAIVALAELT
jgi:hypothetical protein